MAVFYYIANTDSIPSATIPTCVVTNNVCRSVHSTIVLGKYFDEFIRGGHIMSSRKLFGWNRLKFSIKFFFYKNYSNYISLSIFIYTL